MYRSLAIRLWGAPFWIDAGRRRTSQRFAGFHRELFQMREFDRMCVQLDMEPWREAEYRAWWNAEAIGIERRSGLLL